MWKMIAEEREKRIIMLEERIGYLEERLKARDRVNQAPKPLAPVLQLVRK